jgi:outer membrane immunogenic protein
MRSLALAAAALLASCAAAAAADLPRPPPIAVAPAPYMGWSGFYVGVNVGGGMGNGRHDFGIAAAPGFASVNNLIQGAIGGGQVGFNWQTGIAVVGVEADFQGTGIKGSLTAPCLPALCGLPLSATYSQKLPWFGTVRGRLGVTSAGWLIYATGGFVYGSVENYAAATAGVATAVATLNQVRTGWTIGGGVEVAFAPGWSAKLEYLYFEFGRVDQTFVVGGGLPNITDSAALTMNVVRAGVNYRF